MRDHQARQFKILAACAVAAITMSLPLFVLAHDWGRWVHIHAVSLGLILLALLVRGQTEGWAAPARTTPGPIAGMARQGHGYLVLVVLYATMWDLNLVGGLIGGGFAGKILGVLTGQP